MSKCHRRIYSIQVDFSVNQVELTKCCYLHGQKISIQDFLKMDDIFICPNNLPSEPYHTENCLLNCDFDDNIYDAVDICCCNMCNARCYNCCAADHDNNVLKGKDLLYNFILPKVKGHKLEKLQLDGKGEVFLNYYNLVEFLKTLSKEEDFKQVRFLTNGSTLNKKRIQELKKISEDTGIDYIFAVSIDGISKETFEAVRCGLSFENVMSNLKTIVEIFGNDHIDITFTIKQPNKEDAPYIKEFLQKNYNILPSRVALQSDFWDKEMNKYLDIALRSR